MPAGVSCDDLAYSAGTKVVGPLSSFALGCRGLSSVTAVVVVVCRTSCGGAGANISGIELVGIVLTEVPPILLSLD